MIEHDAASIKVADAEKNEAEVKQYNSDNFADAIAAGELKTTPSGLVDGAFLLGTTQIDWRTGFVNDSLKARGITSFNPDMGANWQKKHIAVEALAMSRMSVLAMRLEKSEENAGMGSLTEIGIALFSARIKGQRVIVSIAADYPDTLTDPGSRAQYEAIRIQLDSLSKIGGQVEVLYESSREEYVEAVREAVDEQTKIQFMQEPLSSKDIQNFAKKRKRRLAKKKKIVVYGGSSASFSSSKEDLEDFADEQKLVEGVWENDEVIALNKDEYSERWEKASRLVDDEGNPIPAEDRENAMRLAFALESGVKQHADVLLWAIKRKATTPAGVAEAAFFAYNAIDSGQPFMLLLEKFDEDDCLAQFLAKNKETLEKAHAEDPEALEILADAKDHPEKITLRRVKQSSLGKEKVFQKVNNISRSRAIASEQYKILQADVQKITGDEGTELMTFATDFTDFLQKESLVKTPEAAGNREEYYENFKKFKANLDALAVEHAGKPEKFLESVVLSFKKLLSPEKYEQVKPLLRHLDQTKEFAEWLFSQLEKRSTGKEYLSKNRANLFMYAIAPLHDAFRLLGAPDVQSMPDHQMMIGYIIRTYAPKFGFFPAQTEFMTKVAEDHENVLNEQGRSDFAKSEDPIERAKALFFIDDTLTAAIVENDAGEWEFDGPLLAERFTDLYFRHIDPVKGKIFRPIWGLFTLRDFLGTFTTLKNEYGIKLAPSFLEDLFNAALAGIDKAIRANEIRVENNTHPSEPFKRERELTQDQLDEINDVRTTMVSLKVKTLGSQS